MDDPILKATLRAAEQCDPPICQAAGKGRILGKEARGQQGIRINHCVALRVGKV
ncbi:MAG: hypothetical protein NTNFB02_34060 [Nitrospira sp.]